MQSAILAYTDDMPQGIYFDDDGYNDEVAAQIDAYDAEVKRPSTMTDKDVEAFLDAACEYEGYDEWTDAQKEHEPLPQPQDFARRLYDDLDVWEVPSYGRVWQTEGVYTHNGPKGSQLRRYFEDRDDAIQNLIDCVHKQLDDERAKQFDRDASLGHYGGWR